MNELLLEISYKCNLNCIHCSSINCNEKIKINDLNEFSIINNIDVVRLSGGEPTLNNNLIEYINFFKDRNIKIILQTNGYNLLSKHILNNIDEINLSLYSNKEVHNFITHNNCTYDNIIKFIEMYKNKKRIIICSPIFTLTDCINVINDAKYYNLSVRFTSLLNHGKCNFAKSIDEQINIYNKIKYLWYKIISHCSLINNYCEINNKYVIKPNLELFNCASHKQNKKLCKL